MAHTSRVECQESADYAETDETVLWPSAGWVATVAECTVCGRDRYDWRDPETGELMETEYFAPDGTAEFREVWH